MSKYSGKLLTVYISPTGIRVLEGENRTGNPVISRYFTVSGVEEYFTKVGSDSRSIEISNLAGLVSAVVTECKNRHVTTRRVMVCSDCFGILTTLTTDGGGGGLRNIMNADIKDIGKIFSGGGHRDPVPPDKMACDITWGSLPKDGVVRTIGTRSLGDRYLLTAIVREFYTHGYEVIYISGATEALLNFRQTEECSFDSQGKVVVNIDIDCSATAFYQDIPVNMHNINLLEDTQLVERVTSLVDGSIQYTGRNPRVYLAGSAFKDTTAYEHCIEVLENRGYVVFDLFAHNDLPYNYEELVASGEMSPVLTADYSANIAMLMCNFAKFVVALTPSLGLGGNLKKNAKMLAVSYLLVSICAFIYCAFLAVGALRGSIRIAADPSPLQSMQQQVTSLQARQSNLNATLATITQADTLVLDIMKFVVRNQTEDVHIVTVDTSDIISATLRVSTGESKPEDEEIEIGSAGGPTAAARGSIIIRGYAKTGNAAIAYFDKLFLSNLPVDPVLNGVERYTLPDGDDVYVFEIEIGERSGGEYIE